MVRRTLLLFVGFVLLVLAVTVGYALLGLSGPRTAIESAEAAAAEGRHAEAVRLLDIAERTLTAREQSDLLPAILQLRFRAHRKLGNVPAARRDLEDLLALRGRAARDSALLVAYAEVLLAAGEPEEALDVVTGALPDASGADHARLLELAGEAHQALYQRGISRLMKKLEENLSDAARQRAVAYLRTALYRTADDPVAVRALAMLRETLRRSAATPIGYAAFERDIADVRAGIAQALGYFRRSLEAAGGEPNAALRGLSFALENGGRIDEQRAVEDLYLRRFDHPETVYAAVLAVERELAAGHHAEAARLAARFLPPGTARARAEDDRFPPAAKRLMVAHARALYALGDQAGLDRLVADLHATQEAGVDILPEICLLQMFAGFGRGDDLHEPFRGLTWKLNVDPPRSGDAPDYYGLGADLMVRSDRERGELARAEATLDAWCKARPNDMRARRLRCELLLETGRAELALADAAVLLQDARRDDEALRLYVRAADLAAVPSGRDAATTLARLAARGSLFPAEPHDPALYLALGELALEKGVPALAARCGDLAGPSFPWAEWPRKLATIGALRLDQPAIAVQAADAYRAAYPHSKFALEAYRTALRQAGRKAPELRFDLARLGIADGELACALLDAAIARGDRLLVNDLARRTMFRFAGDARVVLRAAVGLLAAGDVATARDLLLRIPAVFPDDREACLEAASRFLLLEAKSAPDSPLLPLAVRTLTWHADGDAKPLLAVAAELEQAGQPRLVLAVLEPILADDAYRAARSGRVYALAGRASLALDRQVKAEELLLRAIAFEDGEVAAPALALLCLQQKRRSEAESAMWLKEATDEASACLLLRLDRREPALAWARARKAEQTFDVVATLILALAGTPEDQRQVPAGFAALVRAEGKAVLETISLLAMPGFQVLGEKAARALHERVPTSAVAHFLWARSLALVGRRDAAVAELTALTQRAPEFLPAYDEVLRITDGGFTADLGAILPNISTTVLAAPHAATPRMRAMVGQALASQIGVQTKDPGAALNLLARLWIQFPQESGAGLQNVATLLTGGRPGEAFELLRQIESGLPAGERGRFIDFYFILGRKLAASDPSVEGELDAKARAIVDGDGPFGAAVHWLVDRMERQHGPFRTGGEPGAHVAEAADLLGRHLAFIPEFRDSNVAAVLRTLDRLQEIETEDEVLARIDQLLRADPSLLPVWIRRATLLSRRGEVEDALASLRWIFTYVRFVPALVEFARIGGEHDALAKDDHELILAEADETLADDPHAAYALGVAAFRRGDLAMAAELLAKARVPDGSHLWFSGLVALAQNDAPETPRRTFEALVEEYPGSPHAHAARHLAIQLARLAEGE